MEVAALLPLQVAGVEGEQDAGRAHRGAGHPLPARHRHSQQDGRRHLTPSLRLSPRRAPGADQPRTRAHTPLARWAGAPLPPHPADRAGRGAPRRRHVRPRRGGEGGVARLGVLWRRLAAIRRHCRAPPYPPPPPGPGCLLSPRPGFSKKMSFSPFFLRSGPRGGGEGGSWLFLGRATKAGTAAVTLRAYGPLHYS